MIEAFKYIVAFFTAISSNQANTLDQVISYVAGMTKLIHNQRAARQRSPEGTREFLTLNGPYET